MGKSEAIIDAPPETVTALLWDMNCEGAMQHQRKNHDRASFDLFDGSMTPAIYKNGVVRAMLKKLPWPLNRREFVIKRSWCAESSDTYYVALESVRPDFTVDYGMHVKKLRGFLRSIFKIER